MRMKVLKISILIIFLSLFGVSCKTHETISVIVVDKLTKQPLDSVFVKVTDGKKNDGDCSGHAVTGYTDSIGKFEATIKLGYAFGNNHIYLSYEKAGYVNKEDLTKQKGLLS